MLILPERRVGLGHVYQNLTNFVLACVSYTGIFTGAGFSDSHYKSLTAVKVEIAQYSLKKYKIKAPCVFMIDQMHSEASSYGS